jgi:sulfite reductase alpha subunit-like flavoprotein
MENNEKIIYILYGSQSGNSESIAIELEQFINNLGYKTKCMSLNNSMNIDIKNNNLFTIFICSTFGNGDAPENASKWWRYYKKRSLEKDLFYGINYTVLALGDSNYDKFCQIGKNIDRRINELGGIRKIEITLVDSINLEEVVEKWNNIIINYINNF